MGERTESSNESSAQNEAPMSKPPKKLKLSVPKDKENRWQIVDDAMEAAFSKQFVDVYLKITLQAPNGQSSVILATTQQRAINVNTVHRWVC